MKITGIIILYCIFVVFLLPISHIKHIELNKQDNEIIVYNTEEDTTNKMMLEEYVLKVLEKEMPSSFESEALKAQAVAIRTYALKKKNSALEEHKGGDVCTDYKHCMAFQLNEDNLSYEQITKYKQAVNDTKNQILTYNDEPAATFFFALSNGYTQNCKDVWGSDIPYLRSVTSENDKTQESYISTSTFSKEEILNILGIDLSKEYELKKYNNGYIESLITDENILSGKEIREKLNLKSSCFEIIRNDDEFTFKVYGNGHGVGMSQFGANEMAKQGKDYKEILSHYYQGTKLEI